MKREEDFDEMADDSIDDIEPVRKNSTELYEHFRVVVDKGQYPVRIDRYLSDRFAAVSRHRIQL